MSKRVIRSSMEMPTAVSPARGYCKICGKPLKKQEVQLCRRCHDEEQVGPTDYS